MASTFANIQLKRNGGGIVKAEELQGKIVALYFSVFWCCQCTEFSPKLKSFYEEAVATDGNFEIVFVTVENCPEDQELSLKHDHGNWLYIPYGDQSKELLYEKYLLTDIPKLVIINNDGSIAVENAQDDVKNLSTKDALNKWASKLSHVEPVL